jgi:hypothetical protein
MRAADGLAQARGAAGDDGARPAKRPSYSAHRDPSCQANGLALFAQLLDAEADVAGLQIEGSGFWPSRRREACRW